MKSLPDLLEGQRDADGIVHFNKNASGCPHCGAVEVKTSEVDGVIRSVFYHAGAECCMDRIADQLRWRQGELDELDRKLKAAHARVEQLRDASENAMSGGDAKKFAAQAEKARASMPNVERNLALKAKDINTEIQGLQRRREERVAEDDAQMRALRGDA